MSGEQSPSAPPAPDPQRVEQLRRSLGAVTERVAVAARAAGRDPEKVHVIVVTKTHPASDVQALAQLGVRDVGENKDQEAHAKMAEIADEVRAQLRVHFVGQLQTNKANSVARYADVVHSVDRPKLVTALARASQRAREAGQRQKPLEVLVQADLEQGERAGRGGATPNAVVELAEQVAEQSHLRLRGVMAVAPHGSDAEQAARAFETVYDLSQQVQQVAPTAGWISAGMSDDLEQAIAAGATHLRVGSAILGSRPSAR